MRLSMQCDSGGARARSEERALGLTPFYQASCLETWSTGKRGNEADMFKSKPKSSKNREASDKQFLL